MWIATSLFDKASGPRIPTAPATSFFLGTPSAIRPHFGRPGPFRDAVTGCWPRSRRTTAIRMAPPDGSSAARAPKPCAGSALIGSPRNSPPSATNPILGLIAIRQQGRPREPIQLFFDRMNRMNRMPKTQSILKILKILSKEFWVLRIVRMPPFAAPAPAWEGVPASRPAVPPQSVSKPPGSSGASPSRWWMVAACQEPRPPDGGW